jgi:hypothetical protein
MNEALILNLDEQWERRADSVWQTLPDYPALEEPAQVLTDFGKSVSGVFVASGPSRYLDAIIARRLRDDGLIDSEARILIHAIERGGSSHQVFYTAVPAENWQRLQTWAQSQPEHCLLIAHAGLMARLLTGDNAAVVFHCNREISLLSRQRGVLSYYSIMTLNTRDDGLLETVGMLMRRVPVAAGVRLRLRWYSFGEALSPELEHALRAQLAASGVTEPDYEAPRQAPEKSSLLRLLERPFQVVKLAANPAPAKIAWLAESQLPRLGLCLALCAALLGGWGYLTQDEARSLDEEVARSRAAMRQTADAAVAEALAPDLAATRELIEAMANAQSAIDPHAFLLDLRAVATANAVHILRVRMEARSVTIEGRIEALGGRDDSLAAFLVALRRLGFTAEAVAPAAPSTGGGFFAYRLVPGAARKGANT